MELFEQSVLGQRANVVKALCDNDGKAARFETAVLENLLQFYAGKGAITQSFFDFHMDFVRHLFKSFASN